MRLAFITLVAVVTSAPVAQDKQPYKEEETGLVFAVQLGKWKRTEVREPGGAQGVAVVYDGGAGRTATVFVYTAGLETIPDGVSPAVKDQFALALEEVKQVLVPDGWTVKKVSDGEVRWASADKLPALQAVFHMEGRDGLGLVSHVYLTGYKNHFLKVRIAHSKQDGGGTAAIKGFLADVGKLLKK